MLFSSKRLLVLTGAGISTESGVPDYRSPGRPEYKPMQQPQFISDRDTRQRYWARSTIGYARLTAAAPNDGHRMLAALERRRDALGLQTQLVTQNVDGLHARAGSPAVLELHGTIHRVGCLSCGVDLCRAELQQELERHNGPWLDRHGIGSALVTKTPESTMQRPDGDSEVPEEAYASFRVPRPCQRPGRDWSPVLESPSGQIIAAAVRARQQWHGPSDGGALGHAEALRPPHTAGGTGRRACHDELMPRVVFHGGSLPAAVTAQSRAMADGCDALVVLGSTLSVFSAFRIVRGAKAAGARVAIVNHGETRADPLADVLVDASIGAVLRAAADLEGGAGASDAMLASLEPASPSPVERLSARG